MERGSAAQASPKRNLVAGLLCVRRNPSWPKRVKVTWILIYERYNGFNSIQYSVNIQVEMNGS